MGRFHGKPFYLAALTLTVLLIAGLIGAGGSLCSLMGCGLLCSACGAACEGADLESCPESGGFDLYTTEPMWDGPGSIQETPQPTEAQASEATGDLFGDQSKAETAPAVREKRVRLKNDGTDTVTVLVLMNGSDLESDYGEATMDLIEMVSAQKSDRVRILVETVGTRYWNRYFGIASNRSQRYLVMDDGLRLLDDSLGQLDTTVPETLSDFIRWGSELCPADRYILLLWDHGGGPVYGYGYDEYQGFDSALTIDEMQIALRDGGVYFDLIGMDCCLMSSLEVCCALYEFCDYTLLSEDFEPSVGWEHEAWLSALAENPAIPTPELAAIAIESTVRTCEADLEENGGATLAMMDEAYMKLLYAAWTDFAYANEEALLSTNYSQLRESSGRAHPRFGGWTDDDDEATLKDYFITDLLSLAENIPSEQSTVLKAALQAAVLQFGATSDETTLTGISVTLPYGDAEFYTELRRVYHAAGFDRDYIEWLGKFVNVENGQDNAYDFGGWGDLWGGWDAQDDASDWGDWPFSDLWGDEDWSDSDWANDDWFDALFGGQ